MVYNSEVFIVGEESGELLSKTIHDEVSLNDKEHYSIQLINKHPNKMIANIKIAGNHIGDFVVNGYGSYVIDRPSDVANKFQCVLIDSLSAEELQCINTKTFNEVQITVGYEKPIVTCENSPNKRNSSNLETDFGRALRVTTDTIDSAGTILSRQLSDTKYSPVKTFPIYADKDVYLYKLKCKPKVKTSPTSKLIIK